MFSRSWVSGEKKWELVQLAGTLASDVLTNQQCLVAVNYHTQSKRRPQYTEFLEAISVPKCVALNVEQNPTHTIPALTLVSISIQARICNERYESLLR